MALPIVVRFLFWLHAQLSPVFGRIESQQLGRIMGKAQNDRPRVEACAMICSRGAQLYLVHIQETGAHRCMLLEARR